MIKKFCLVACLLSSAAFAQEENASAIPAPAPSRVIFSFTMEQLQTIAKAVSKLPYEEAAPVIAELQKQLSAQQQKSEPIKHK